MANDKIKQRPVSFRLGERILILELYFTSLVLFLKFFTSFSFLYFSQIFPYFSLIIAIFSFCTSIAEVTSVLNGAVKSNF